MAEPLAAGDDEFRKRHWDHVHWAMANSGLIREPVLRAVDVPPRRDVFDLIRKCFRRRKSTTQIVVNITAAAVPSEAELARAIREGLCTIRRNPGDYR